MMKSLSTQPIRYEFCFPEQDTQILVEVGSAGVTVRATRDSFNEQRKASFVRELVAEGFIAENYQWFLSSEPESYLGVHWLVDHSWLATPRRGSENNRQLMRWLMAGVTLVSVGMIALYCLG